jgi:hypothetical protein
VHKLPLGCLKDTAFPVTHEFIESLADTKYRWGLQKF